ncbi:hypothetical protein NQ317_016290 [Molorchus minor]|uniref:Tyr recombinase domain-containing protein n=1 Tax=Molorchus minor TaxID=1323400 RepID=A0ABQ9IYA3_9CUCU|nr:hypothetical protein NQ317_016290 [Molorchus minor]
MGKIPNVVASYLKLPDVACYTGHCLRRSSATLLADAGVDITTIKRHAGWKSTTVTEGYVENSIENKTKIANQVLVGTTTRAITKTVNVSESNIPSNINFENCTNVTFNLNHSLSVEKLTGQEDISVAPLQRPCNKEWRAVKTRSQSKPKMTQYVAKVLLNITDHNENDVELPYLIKAVMGLRNIKPRIKQTLEIL